MKLPIDCGVYRTRDGKTVEIFEMGSFAYGRVQGEDVDFWVLETGEYTAMKQGPHGLDLVEQLPQPSGNSG